MIKKKKKKKETMIPRTSTPCSKCLRIHAPTSLTRADHYQCPSWEILEYSCVQSAVSSYGGPTTVSQITIVIHLFTNIYLFILLLFFYLQIFIEYLLNTMLFHALGT